MSWSGTVPQVMSTEPQPYDLRALFKAVGRVGGRGGDNAAQERVDSAEPVELLEHHPLEVSCDPATVLGFVDGIQAQMHLTHIERRPVSMYYVAAGSLGAGAAPLALVERLRIQCTETDRDWVESLGSGIPVELLHGDTPPELENAALQAVGRARDDAERSVVGGLIGTGEGLIVVDGSLLARPRAAQLVGVVKTTRSRYLSDERVVWELRRGWRSPRFTIGSGSTLRYSCYVQLVEKSDGAWNLGLIRLESFDLDHLEPMAARCLLEAQTRSSGDARWDRHLGSVRAVEEFLRARRPAAFSM
jgi:hypothetical protein